MSEKICAVLGVGPGNGAAIAEKFAKQGYAVALCARNEERLKGISNNIPGSRTYAYDVQDTGRADTVFAQINEDLGPVDTLIYNAGAGQFGNIDDAAVEVFQSAWEVNARGLFAAVKSVLPQMRSQRGGSIIVIGATASVKAGANFAAFASAKSAQRALAQSMAKHLGPEKIHVAYVVIDGVINLARTREMLPDKPDDFFLQPDEIADTVYFLSQQPQQAWTFELDLRPFGEKW
jgi:NADP-dependent 3-hydroxy acid dehydrogenase YdfG